MRKAPQALAVAALLLAAGCGGGGSKTTATFSRSGAPVRFSYPKELAEVTPDAREIRGRAPVFRIAFGQDPTDAVLVATYRLAKPAEQYDGPTFLATLDSTALRLARAQRYTSGKRQQVKVGALAGYAYDLSDGSSSVVQRLVYAFRERDEIFIRCIWTADPDAAKAIRSACDEVQRSLALR